MISVLLRLQCASEDEATTVVAELKAIHGSDLTIDVVQKGRGIGVWFIRGTLRVGPRPLVDAIIYSTKQPVQIPQPDESAWRPFVDVLLCSSGEIVHVPDPTYVEQQLPPPMPDVDVLAAARRARLSRLGAREPEPDDGLDRHALHKQLRRQHDDEQKRGT